MPLRRTPEQKAAREAEKASEREAFLARQEVLRAQARILLDIDGLETRETRARVDKSGYTMQENYGLTINADGTITVGDPRFEDSVTMPFAGAHAEIETPANARSRVTATRVATLGVLALAVPKNDKRLFLVVTSGPTEAVNLVDGSDAMHLRRWVAAFNTQGAEGLRAAAADPLL